MTTITPPRNLEDMMITKTVTSPHLITVIGVGGGGCNVVNYMIANHVKNVSFAVCNTDSQALHASLSESKIELGRFTDGLGAGTDPEVGRKAAEESLEQINSIFTEKTKMVFVVTGLGGGTGTGASPVIAREAKKRGFLTVGVVTMPFLHEFRKEIADEGLEKLKEHVDSLIVIDNDNISKVFKGISAKQAFNKGSEVMATATRGIIEMIQKVGEINIDFADIRTALQNSGRALIGMGYGDGENRVSDALKGALYSPLLNQKSIRGAETLLTYIIAKHEDSLSIDELQTIMSELVQETGHRPKNIKHGLAYDEKAVNELTIIVIVAGFKGGVEDTEIVVNQDTLQESHQEFIIEEEPAPSSIFPSTPTSINTQKNNYAPQKVVQKPIWANDNISLDEKEKSRFQMPANTATAGSSIMTKKENGTFIIHESPYSGNNKD